MKKNSMFLLIFVFLFFIDINSVLASDIKVINNFTIVDSNSTFNVINQNQTSSISFAAKSKTGSNIKTNLDYNSLCSNEGVHSSIKIISAVISIVKIAVPLIIIVLGMIDFFKAVTSDDEKAISKATQSLIRRLISGVIIFFIPSLLWALLNVIDITDGIHDLNNSEFGICTKCILNSKC